MRGIDEQNHRTLVQSGMRGWASHQLICFTELAVRALWKSPIVESPARGFGIEKYGLRRHLS